MKFARRANPTLTFALCASLVLHALLLLSFLYWYVHRPPIIAHVAVAADNTRAAIIVDLPVPEPKKPEPRPKTSPPPPPPPPPKQVFAHAPPPPPRDDSGEASGVGTANRSSPGVEPMQAAHGLEQSKLSRNPKPMPDDSASSLDTPSVAPQQPAVINSPTPSAVGLPSLDDSATPAAAEHPKLIAVADPNQPARLPPKTRSPTVRPAAAVKKPEAQPGRSSDTDSTPFAKANSVTFKDGKMLGRQGRRVRTTHIGFGLAAESDAFSLPDPRVVLGVTVDALGSVQNVIVLRSSGSDNIDLPAQNAVYNWWFEPLKNPAGQPLPDVWVVTIE